VASFNKVVIAGHMTRDVELKYLQSGTAVTDISIAINDKRKGGNGEWVDEVSFIDVTLFGRTAEVAGEYTRKGSNVLIEGRLKQDIWEKDGQKRSKIKVIAERLVMLGSKNGGQQDSRQESKQTTHSATQSTPSADNDIPF
jgi:single-strand DNA-binding protein